MTNSINIKDVSKCYKVYSTRNNRLKDWIFPFSKKRYKEKWVLKNINLEIKQGEAVGIIGINGAGKSTLLKIITGTTLPTTGHIELNGSVAALLELGIGFHPDFTGRQNIYISGQLLGYTKEEITSCMQIVEEFAEIGEAIDAPVRTYSSGMQIRLAFSVATMKRPDILIVDEALSVGDNYFQHKSFSRIKEFIKKGTTLLLVSHDKATIQAVCDRAVLLNKGEVLKTGNPEEIMDYYNALISKKDDVNIEQRKLPSGKVQTISGNGYVKVTNIELINSKKIKSKIIYVGENVELCVKIIIKHDIKELSCGFQIKNRLGEIVYGINTGKHNKKIYDLKENEELEIKFSFCMNIGEGNYSITIGLHNNVTHLDENYEWIDLALIYEVINKNQKPFEGQAFLETQINILREKGR